MAAVTGARRGELCGLQWADIDLGASVMHIAFSYLARGGQKLRKDTKTHQDRRLAIDPVTCGLLAERRRQPRPLWPRWASHCRRSRTCSRATRLAIRRGTRIG